ncbi:MAG: lysine exporter LysO family protein, partial [Deltaproteobacteria bacterium]|nr:lysine exporter LysO family protein [Deltaproteobacteria bacterium]
MKGSLIILFFFCSGVLLARLGLIPTYLLEHDFTVYALWLLMLLVGISIGSDRRLGEILRTLRPRVLLLPLATTVGTFAGTALVSLFLSYSVSECMAVGAGFAYYSLSSIFISQYKGAELGTIALISNIARELITLLLTPLLARHLGPLIPISCGGAST